MEELLRVDFTAYYGLPKCNEPNIVITTDLSYFEVEDNEKNELVIHQKPGEGMASFSNPSQTEVTIINYDKFITSLPTHFQRGKKRCDILVITLNSDYFILGELKDSPNIKGHRNKAKKQLIESLSILVAVPEISDLIYDKTTKRCCYFNKQSKSPTVLTAITAFNRLSSLFPEGFQMEHKKIESLGFEFWEYTGMQVLTLNS